MTTIIFKNKRSFSLTEILISAFILVIASTGLFASFIAANRYVNMSKRRMAAVNLARQVSERLYTRVSADTWTNSGINLLACPDNGTVPGLDNTDYPCNKTVLGAEYSIDADNPLANYAPTVTLTIDLVGTVPLPANCYLNCPRNVSIGVSWNE
jgi:type II secretory pathway pseudopilin PulG